PDRELWILGSTDNYSINVEGNGAVVGDNDAYNIEFLPCADVPVADKAACESATHQVMVQIHIRDFAKELAPMLIVTDTDRTIFRGHSIYNRVEKIDPNFTAVDKRVSAACQSSFQYGDTVTFTAGSPGTVVMADH